MLGYFTIAILRTTHNQSPASYTCNVLCRSQSSHSTCGLLPFPLLFTPGYSSWPGMPSPLLFTIQSWNFPMPITSTMLYLTPPDCMDFLTLALLLRDIPSFHFMNFFFLSQNKTECHNELISFWLAQGGKTSLCKTLCIATSWACSAYPRQQLCPTGRTFWCYAVTRLRTKHQADPSKPKSS